MKIYLSILILFFVFSNDLLSQENYQRINVQGQFPEGFTGEDQVGIDIIVYGLTNDTLWHETHPEVELTDHRSFDIEMGGGNFVSGNIADFSLINWKLVDHVSLYHNAQSELEEIASYVLSAVPYSFHSLHTEYVPVVQDLSDTPNLPIETSRILIFDGEVFVLGNDELSDTAGFAFSSNQTNYSDTSLYAYFSYSDTTALSLFSDSSNYSYLSGTSIYSSQTNVADTTNISLFSLNNWGVNGNMNIDTNQYLGTIDAENLIFRTNNQSVLVLDTVGNMSNDTLGAGVRIRGTVLFELGGGESLTYFDKTHMYFNGQQSLFHGGSPISGLDTLSGEYSFSWGDNVGTNGRYSSIFGKDCFGDSSLIYDAYSSFALGNNCRVSRTGIAIGLNNTANYYRNVAVGKDVYCGGASSSIGFGNNIVSSGATTWAFGNNITASGHFSTAIGTNASTNTTLGTFVYGDFSTTDTVYNTTNNEFVIRADGGIVFYSSSDLTMGVSLSNGAGSWDMISDKRKKEHIKRIKQANYIDAYNQLPIYRWSYTGEDERHVGPMAQDFNTYFKVGELDNYINMIDIDGVTLLGIIKTNRKINKEINNYKIKGLSKSVQTEKQELDNLEQKIKELYEKMDF